MSTQNTPAGTYTTAARANGRRVFVVHGAEPMRGTTQAMIDYFRSDVPPEPAVPAMRVTATTVHRMPVAAQVPKLIPKTVAQRRMAAAVARALARAGRTPAPFAARRSTTPKTSTTAGWSSP